MRAGLLGQRRTAKWKEWEEEETPWSKESQHHGQKRKNNKGRPWGSGAVSHARKLAFQEKGRERERLRLLEEEEEERKRKAEEEEEKKKQKLDKSLRKELAKSSSTSRSASESSEGRGRSQPVKLTPAPTAVEKTVVKEEPDWSEESEAPKKGKKKTVTGPKLDKSLDPKVTDGPQGSIQVPSYASDVASLASKPEQKGLLWIGATPSRWARPFPKAILKQSSSCSKRLVCFPGLLLWFQERAEGQDNPGHLASQV